MLLQEFQNTICTPPRMDQQRFIHFVRQLNHLDKNLFLNLPGGVNLAIKPHFTERDNLGMLKKVTQFLKT